MKITHEQNGIITIVSVIGRLDAGTAPQLIEYLDAVPSEAYAVGCESRGFRLHQQRGLARIVAHGQGGARSRR